MSSSEGDTPLVKGARTNGTSNGGMLTHNCVSVHRVEHLRLQSAQPGLSTLPISILSIIPLLFVYPSIGILTKLCLLARRWSKVEQYYPKEPRQSNG